MIDDEINARNEEDDEVYVDPEINIGDKKKNDPGSHKFHENRIKHYFEVFLPFRTGNLSAHTDLNDTDEILDWINSYFWADQ